MNIRNEHYEHQKRVGERSNQKWAPQTPWMNKENEHQVSNKSTRS
jgi:hypothetical protein